jgi:hydroxymethylbilane synthase
VSDAPAGAAPRAARLVIGSRGSALALAQAEAVAAGLRAVHPRLEIAITTVATTGDRLLDVPLAKIGDKGLFTKELETALLDGRIDLAVHSAKDLPTALPAGLALSAFTRREDARDVFVAAPGARRPAGPAALPAAARIGSSSLRRRAQLLALRPDLRVVDLRGNVETRLRKLADDGLDGTVLAAAGLQRLGRADVVAFTFTFDEMLPAVGQGALAVETRAGDERVAALVAGLNDGPTALAVRAERALLAALEGGCQVPLGAHAELLGGSAEADRGSAGADRGSAGAAAGLSGATPGGGAELLLRAFVCTLDGGETVRDTLRAPAGEPEALGGALAERLRAAGAGRILAALRDAALTPGSAG